MRDELPASSATKFTVSDAARAFRTARGGAAKVTLIEGVEDSSLRASGEGGFVFVHPSPGKDVASGKARRRTGKKRSRKSR
jgi:hypothetical protein